MPARPARRLTAVVLAAVAVLAAAALALDPTLRRIVYYNLSDVDDYRIFSNRALHPSPEPFRFREAGPGSTGFVCPPAAVPGSQALEDFLTNTQTLAFLALYEDRLVYERYFAGHGPGDLSMVFSVTKALMSALVGASLEDGYLGSLDQPVTDYVPELESRGFDAVRLSDLLQMTSGMPYTERGLVDNPFGKQARLAYTERLEAELLNSRLTAPPGTRFVYKSADTALLALALSRALRGQTLTGYLQARLWTPLGMEFSGLWSIDHAPDGLEKAWCCVSMTARDLLKLGRLYLRGGDWEGRQLLPAAWIRTSTMRDTARGSPQRYQYAWWLMSPEQGDYRAEGVRGQFVYVNPTRQLVVVRLGRSRGGLDWGEWKQFFSGLGACLDQRAVSDGP